MLTLDALPQDEIVVHPWSRLSLGMEFVAIEDRVFFENTPSSNANLAWYIPVVLHHPLLVAKMFAFLASSVTYDVAIYDEFGTIKLVSTGPTTASGLSVVDVTDTQLDRGRYWLGAASSSSNAAFGGSALAVQWADFLGMKEQASAYSSGLPSVPTMATPTVGSIPAVGFTASTVT